MKLDTQYAVATAPKRDSKSWRSGTVTWGEVLSWLDSPADSKECGNYLMGTLKGTRRVKDTILSRSMITLDADKARPELLDQLTMVFPYASATHTTYNSAPDGLRVRIMIPTDREMAPDEYHQASSVIMDQLGRDMFDPGSVEPERYMFRPSAQRREWYQKWVVDGPAADVDALLKDWDPDLSSAAAPRVSPNKRDPYEVEGTVGAFNRAYTIPEAIEVFELPYEPAGADRWHLVGARAEAGMSEVSPGLVYSHHVTDPAHGRACSAFDLVRVHLYGDRDEGKPASTPVNRLPSHLAMLELASTDAKVVAEIVGRDFTSEMDEETTWKLDLRLTQTGRFKDVVENWDLIQRHDPVFKLLVWNELTLAVEITGPLPWRPMERGGATFGPADRASLLAYVEREYHVRPARALMDDLVLMSAWERFTNPVREYLKGLVWDGKPRVEVCLPGVKPTRYTRLVARKCLVAAAARMLDPGIKWDHTLVLFGPEGLGKSHWIERMARGYSSTLGRIGDKDTLLIMQRSWIMVSDEGYSLRKADSDVRKEFLTRTSDVFRMPYDRESLVHPRHCVIWGSTNDEVFLRREEGNRRFLIVPSEGAVDFTRLTEEYVSQVWAEAVHLYRQGELLFLSEDERELAADNRERYTEEDALAGVVQEFLETMVPEDWEDQTPDSRREWLQARNDGLVAAGTRSVERTCSAQIWVEVLGRRFGDHQRTHLLEIANVLKKTPGWRVVPGRHRLPGYGPQVLFERVPGWDLL
ncbi:VapE domain-containing protein [Tessaracoccus sp.]